ncbi:PKD domain-containing protein [Paenarthrobacter sp. PH39-S1]|uniref:PKD domain-containing protein n=1 Tax=Paenarthrobacter sp. PH39-S1 TaxID=3046204 RepID=UPI0024BAAAC7|nr:PKD domain-containing protein [Paenarthrobacter sp. PH39-S1]MDJ0356117.1 PKD domain-containing protein [Paenarthrobacter sp. PH39-S1]
MAFSALVAIAAPVSAASAVRDGSTAASAAASCWEIKQDNASAQDGTYWLLTPAMNAPGQFYCDMTTDGGGWVLVGKGREGWTEANRGTGSQTALRTAGLSPMSGATSQLPATAIDGLLNNGRVDALSDGIRLKRATNADGSAWQESRFNTNKGDRWVWTFGAEHQVAWYSFDGVRGGGGLTSNFGPDNAYRQINASELSAQGYRIGFAYGSAVTGTSSSTSYLWSATDGLGNAMPYTEMYLRPQIRSLDAGFTRIADGGTAVKTNTAVANSLALDSPWGVSGPKTPTKEGDVEVQAFAQSGNVMYVGGNFTSVQRSATATGADKVSQSFLAAFDVNTGELMRGFTPVLNAPVQALAALPNGNIVAAGIFTQANGAPASAIVALNPATGATVGNWALKVENRTTNGVLRVSSLSINGNWLYLGGAFTHLSGGTNPNSPVYAKGAARVAVADGTPGTGWNPDFNGTVVAIDAADDGSRLYAAGYFTTSGTAPALKAAAVQSAAGAPLATPAWTPTFSNSNNYQQTIGQVGDRVWLGGSEHSFFSYSTSSFDLLSGNIGKNHGDFQAMSVSRTGVIYAGSHGHDWVYSNAFSWPNVGTGWTEADSFEWIGAWDAATGNLIPGFTPSMKFRLGQGVWATTVDSNGTMWTGGDMTTVATSTSAGRWAGGFARFPQLDAVAPTTPSNVVPSADGPTTVKLAWGASSDSSGTVSYQILRNDRVVATTYATSAVLPKGGENRYFVRAVDAAGNLSASSPVITASGANLPPTAAFTSKVTGLTATFDAAGSTDDGTIASYAWDFGDGTTGSGATASHPYAAAGTYAARLVVTDNGGEKAAVTHEVSMVQPAPTDGYGAAVYGDSPTFYYRLGESTGSTANDAGVSASPGTYSGTVTQGVAGALPGVADTAATFDGSSGLVSSRKSYDNPSTYSLELWFNTTTTRGGKLIGFGDQATAQSNNYDRHVYMQDDGKLVFGTWTGTGNVITTPSAYNDGKWHQMVATQSGAGMVLYVDGVQTGTNPQKGAQAYTGYWRIGGDTTWGSSSPYFAGTLDEAAVYPAALTSGQVAKHYQLGTSAPVANQPPSAAFTAAVQDLHVAVDGSGSADPDGTIAAFAWKFGDGSTAVGATAGHDYAAAGSYDVTLTVTDNQGATAIKTERITVTAPPAANQPPAASFTVTVADLNVALDGSGSTDADGSVASYAWDFGDGGTAAGATATHSYAAAGTYTVTLTVTDDKGATGVKTAPVTVTAPSSGSVDVVLVPAKSSWAWRYETTASAAAWKSPGFDSSSWKTGSGVLGFGTAGLATNVDVAGPTSGRPLAAYFLRQFTVDSAAKVQKLRLSTVADDGVVVYVNGTEVGRSNMPAGAVTFNSYAASAPNTTVANANPVTVDVPVSLLTDGVNTIAAETHVNYRATKDLSFDLSATATVGDAPGPVENQAPVAKFTTTVKGLGITADGSTSTDPDGTIAAYAWNFGDQGSATGVNAQHTYAAAGTYTVSLTVTDNKGATSVTTAPVTVAAPTGPVDIVVVPAKSSWSWRYSAGAPDAAWKNRGFDASAWPVGAGTLGFGSAGLGTNIDVAGAPSTRPLAAYFVGQFNVDSAAQLAKLTLKTAADDGVVVYVNGTEVGRNNMPAGPATFGTYAVTAIRSATAAANPLTIDVPTSLLVDGINTIAVETHVNYRATADMGFDLNAVATTK